MRSLKSTTTTTVEVTSGDYSASSPAAAAAEAMQRSPWHSPVPYLFGGLAAMLGLIAFALLILACSYWKLSGQMNGDDGDDLESGGDGGDEKKGDGKGKGRVVYEEQFAVILAGDDHPTCLATPVTSKAKLFYNGMDSNISDDEKAESGKADFEAAEKQSTGHTDEEESNSNTSSEQSQELHLHQDEEPESSSS
ncbi:hypothetical protein QQ045_004403 [Rhodiola kirilowii]